MTATATRLTILVMAILLLSAVAVLGPRLATGTPTFGPDKAEAGMSCQNNRHYHALTNQQHWVYATQGAAYNGVRKYWKAQDLSTGLIWKLGSKVCY